MEMLERLGAVIHCRTNVPQTLLVSSSLPYIKSTLMQGTSATRVSTTSLVARSTHGTQTSRPEDRAVAKQHYWL